MLLKEFWNKAIEYYCTYKRTDSKEVFDTVFIAVAEESLQKIKENFILNESLSVDLVSIIERNIENVGGVNDSYYEAVKHVHNDLGNPGQYSFLRFSILVVGAFKQDANPLRNYWGDFDTFLNDKNISTIPIAQRTQYLKNIFENLSKYCFLYHKKTFFQLNVFGDNHALVNVGKIKAHSIFQGSTLQKIKKSIYNLGYSDSHNIEDLTYNDIEEILNDSGLDRILQLFIRDDDTKEIVFVCLKIWLKNWIPEQEEKIKLLNGRTSDVKPKLQIHRIWIINSENNIEIKFGFFLKSNLGEDNIFYLNKNKNVYVDVAWGIGLNDNRVLYIIENYTHIIDINTNELGFHFKACDTGLNQSEYALEKITPNPNQYYFIEHTEKRVKIQENPILLASRQEVQDKEKDLIHHFKIKNYKGLSFNLYRIRDSFDYKGISFIKTTNLDIYPIGISDGRSGVKSYLSSFPIKIRHNNLSNGEIHIYYKNEIINRISLTETSFKLICEENIGLLNSGTYSIKYFKEKYVNFPNGNDYLDFEIVESGIGDRRSELSIDTAPAFKYHEFRGLKETKNIEDSFLILYDFDSNLKFKDTHTFFYFFKNNKDEWTILPNKKCFFLQRLKEKPNNFREIYYRYQQDFEYLSKNFKKYNYKISFCERPETIDLTFNINDFYQRNEECRITSDRIKFNCYYFKLEELDDALKEKYPEVEVGDVIYIISNKSESKPENLLKLLNQELFPFKKQNNAGEDN
jgi:hypothetical protein